MPLRTRVSTHLMLRRLLFADRIKVFNRARHGQCAAKAGRTPGSVGQGPERPFQRRHVDGAVDRPRPAAGRRGIPHRQLNAGRTVVNRTELYYTER